MPTKVSDINILTPEVYRDHLISLLSDDLDFHDQPGNYSSHNFHSFPAKFPPQLPAKFIRGLTLPGDIILDPMVGSGTTALEALLNGRSPIGFDIDPLALRISKIKTTYLDADLILSELKNIITKANYSVLNNLNDLQTDINQFFDEPTRKFINQWFLPETQIELFALVKEIKNIEQNELRNFFEVCFSAIVITKSGGVSLALDLGHTRPHIAKKVVDRGGKVIYGDSISEIPSHLTKILKPTFIEYEKRCLQNVRGILKRKNEYFSANISFGNAQSLPLENNSIDLIITSPPYASNAIDYMRAHKFSLIWLGYKVPELSQKRKEYIGGETTTGFIFEALPQFPTNIVQELSYKDKKKALVLHRYFSEMTRVIQEMYRVIKPGKASVVIVGNSTMRGIDTMTAECLGEIGKSIGFDVPLIGIRQLDRNKRMLPAGETINLNSQIQQRMHEEYVIGFYKPLRHHK